MYNMILFDANYRTKMMIKRAKSIECICILPITKYTYTFSKTLFLSALFVNIFKKSTCSIIFGFSTFNKKLLPIYLQRSASSLLRLHLAKR